jgi:hypothetical protein
MTRVVAAHSTSPDGCIADANDSPEQPLGVGGDRLFTWLATVTPQPVLPRVQDVRRQRSLLRRRVSQVGAVIAGRRTYAIS